MRKSIASILILVVTVIGAVPNTREITHEDIREAIMQLVHMARDSVDKLERHEQRERHLGEQLKKAISGLDKRHRASDQAVDVIAKSIARLEERLQNVETMISQKDERERIQLQKTYNTVEGIQETINGYLKQGDGGTTETRKSDTTGTLQAFNSSLDKISSTLQRLEEVVLKEVNEASSNSEIDNLRAATAKLSNTDAKVRHSVTETERILSQYEARLGELQGSSGGAQGVHQDWHPIFLSSLDSHSKILQDLRQLSEITAKDIGKLPHKEDLKHLTNSTHDFIQEVKYQLEASAEKGVEKLGIKLQETHSALTKGQEDMLKSVTDASEMTESLYGDVTKSYEQLLKEVNGLAKVEQVMIQTADNVMDTKRRIEYGVHQILLEVGDLVKLQSKDLNATINRRFDNISATIMDNQTGALTNLSTKIETEISQVWRQIGIMYQQLTASAAVLDHLQQQTEIYVNGSLRTMDSMEGKVGQITGRMGEVDENLNYLLGRLSLVTQEFNMIKSGLGTALDNIRNSFLTVQDKIKDVGPGPNPIPDNEVIPPALKDDQKNQVPLMVDEPKTQK